MLLFTPSVECFNLMEKGRAYQALKLNEKKLFKMSNSTSMDTTF